MANCNHGPLHAPIMGNTPVGICTTKQHVEVAVIHSYHPIAPSCNLNFTAQSLSYSIKLSVFLTMLSFCRCLVLIIYPLSYHEHCCWRKLEVGGVGSPTAAPWNSSSSVQYYLCPAVVSHHCRPRWWWWLPCIACTVFLLVLLSHGSLLEEAGGWRVVPTVPWDCSSYSVFIGHHHWCAFTCGIVLVHQS